MVVRRIISIIILFILLQASVSLAGQEAFSWEPLDKIRVIKAAKTITRVKYPNADAVDVDQQNWIKYCKDGTYTEWHECYTKVLTEKGKRSLKTISSFFTVPYNTTKFTLVEVLKSDGTLVPVDIDKNSRIMTEQSQMASNIYNPNNKILRVNIPELNLGDTIHFIMFDDFPKVRVPDTWSDYVSFEGTNPIKRLEYTVIAPKERPLQCIALKAEIPGTVTHTKRNQGNFIIYRWIAGDVPRAFPEPRMPPLCSQTQRLIVSTIKDWRLISRWYWNLSKPNIEKTTSEMKKTVKELTKGIYDQHEKIEAIFKWVSQEIRYLGLTVEKNVPGYEPHPVSMTFDRRGGVCRDKAALLAAMLRLAGFDAYPVLIMIGPRKDPDVPQPFFNHAITCLREEDGSYLLMDSTDENTKQLFPAYLNNRSYLIATPEGETLRTSPIQPAEQNMMHIESRGSLDAGGNIKAKTVLSFDGINDNIYRGYFLRLSPDELRGYFERITRKIAPGARLINYRITPANMLDTKSPLEATLSFEVKDIIIPGKDIIMLPVLHVGNSIGIVHYLLEEMSLKRRKYPYLTRYACGVKETLKLALNQSVGKLVSLPESEAVENEGTTWTHDLSFKDQTLVIENVFKMKIPEYSPNEYLVLQETLKKIEYSNRKMPIFSTTAAKRDHDEAEWYSAFHADAVVLDEVDEYDLKDANNWTETKHMKIKVLTYAGKKKNSDIYIDYNPIWEDVDVQKAMVTSSSGGIKTIEDKEINKMDVGWVGDAPRYPPARTLVVSFPGVEKGSIIEYTISRKKKNRPFFSMNGAFLYHDMMEEKTAGMGNHSFFSIDGGFRYYYPIVKKTVRLKIPDYLRLKILKADQGIGLETIWKRKADQVIVEKSKHRGNKMVFEFTATKVKPVKHEDHIPPWYSFNPMIFVSAGDWRHYAKDVRQALLKAASRQPKTAVKAHELISSIHDNKQQIVAIRDFVAKNIRPIDLAISDIPLSQITPADKTLDDGYGNSADRAVLLYSLLRTAGYHPEFVLSSWISQVESLQHSLLEYPDPGWFHNVLVRVKIDQGYVYLNDTDQYAVLGSTPNDGRPGLSLQSGQIEIISAATTGLKDRSDVTFFLRLHENGDAMIKKTRKVYGMAFASFHKQSREMSPEKRQRHHQKLVSSISQAAKADGKYITNYKVYPGVEEFSVRVKKYATYQEDYLYLELPGLISGIEGIERNKRDNPMYRNQASRQHVNVEIVLPDGVDSFQTIPPESLLFPVRRSGKIIMETRFLPPTSPLSKGIAPLRLSIQQDINLKPVVVLPEEYLQLLEAHRILGQPKTRMLLLKMKKSPLSNLFKKLDKFEDRAYFKNLWEKSIKEIPASSNFKGSEDIGSLVVKFAFFLAENNLHGS